MAEADIGATFACNQCGTLALQRTGRGRRFTRCACCRSSEPTGSNALRIANAACNQTHVCKGCGASFKPKRAGRTQFCSRACAFTFKKAAPKPPVHRMCSCGASVDTRRRFCGACREASRLAMLERGREAYRLSRGEVTCQDCRVPIANDGSYQRRCEPCRSARASAARRAGRMVRKHRERTATVERFDPLEVLERDGWRCHICRRRTPKAKRGSHASNAPELDHVVPLAKGGEHSRANTACACRRCNLAKSDRIIGQPNLLSWAA